MITVVIPLYNKAHTIISTLSSVLNQSYPDFEVVIVNDGSTDNSIKVIENFIEDNRIRIINQINQGVSIARNSGVRNAKFDYIAFLDGDDEWLPNYLSKMKDAIDQFPKVGMFCSAGIIRNADGSEVLRLAKKYEFKIIKINFFENPHVFLHTSATVVKRSEFNKTEGFPEGMKRNQDFALFFSLALLTPVVYCGYPLSIYIGGVEGQATSVNSTKVLTHIIHRYNYVNDNWLKMDYKNKSYKIFTKYELRHCCLSFIRDNDYNSLFIFLNHLNPDILKLFKPIELRMIRAQFLRRMTIGYMLFTKLRWRLRGYPRVG
jgi:glycosyltransferase involved in cell wall biosynthesis